MGDKYPWNGYPDESFSDLDRSEFYYLVMAYRTARSRRDFDMSDKIRELVRQWDKTDHVINGGKSWEDSTYYPQFEDPAHRTRRLKLR